MPLSCESVYGLTVIEALQTTAPIPAGRGGGCLLTIGLRYPSAPPLTIPSTDESVNLEA